MASLEVEVDKWRDIAQTFWRVKHAKVANTIVAFAEAIRSNQHMSSKIGDALAKLLHTKLDGDKMFERCKVLQRKKNDLADKVDSAIDEKDELANVVVDL